MKVKLNLSVAALCASLSLVAQQPINGRGCATALPPAGWDEAFNKKVDEYRHNLATGRTQATAYTIPVVVHVIYNSQAIGVYPNLSQAQINSQITVLNADYAGNGFNVGNLASTTFSTVGAVNSNITFCLAQVDPDGNPLDEAGIDRISYTTLTNTANPNSFTSQSTFQSYIDNTVKPSTIWDPTRYYNIWVTDVNANVGLLGYSTFPATSGLAGLAGNNSTMSNDGIWVYAKAFGNTGTLQSPYNRGRTATHETGHYLGLRHIGGDGQANGTGNGTASGDCTATDYCADTPPQKGGYNSGQYGQNYGTPPAAAPLHANVCVASGDMFMNFMDYTDDAANYMFTPDQGTRFQTAMATSPYRNQLTASSASMCNLPAVLPVADFNIPSEGCIDTVMVSTNQSTGFPVPTYSWSSNPSTGVVFAPNSTNQNPTIKFANSGTYAITMVATNAAGTNTAINNIVVDNCSDAVTGIAKTSALYRNVNLYPNPSSGNLNIVTTLSASQSLDISIHNSLGQLVLSTKYTNVTTNTFSLNLDAFSNGVYSVTITSGSDTVVKRLLLNK